jgi:DNA-binding response OmpR family regulator
MLSDNNNHHTRVLLVDDEDKILRFLALKLKLFGYDVTTAINGRDAMALVKSINPDILVLDILMPIMDGFEVLEQLRKFSTLPVVVLSAKGDNAERALELGANDFISKPFKPEELVASIEANLDHHGVKQSIS